MNEQELKNIWINHAETNQVIIDPLGLSAELDKQLYKLQSNINRRDRREITVALLLIPIAIYFSITSAYLLMKAGFILMTLHSLFIIYLIRRNKNKHLMPDNGADQMKFLYSSKTYLLNQVKLLDNVLYWYLSPGFISICLILAGAKLSVSAFLSAFALLAFLYIIILLLNKMAIKKILNPTISKINQIINDQNS